MMLFDYPSCRFCGEPAVQSLPITVLVKHEPMTSLSPLCQWHYDFEIWKQTILGRLVRERLHIRDILEEKPRSQFHL